MNNIHDIMSLIPGHNKKTRNHELYSWKRELCSWVCLFQRSALPTHNINRK